MKKLLILPILLFSLSSFASSKWDFVTANMDGDMYYIDVNSYQKSGDLITYWRFRNYGGRDEVGDLSSKSQYTINCRKREIIGRYLITYDDLNNNGKITASFALKNSWMPIPPDTIFWEFMKYICK